MGTLFVIATPIGNMEDLTHRALRVLGEVDALACEDTRVTRKIFDRYGVQPPRTVFAYHEHNEARGGARILGLLSDGLNVGLCSDGGYPGISDPGYRIIDACIESDHPIEIIPGPGAVPTALLASGLPTSSYTFKGFPPRKSGARQRFLSDDGDAAHTLVLFESPHRVAKLLADAVVALGDRRAAVCVEMTKKFEKIHRGWLSDLAAEFENWKARGEVTVVIAGNHPKFCRSDDSNGEDED